jgi:hypothetical protein
MLACRWWRSKKAEVQFSITVGDLGMRTAQSNELSGAKPKAPYGKLTPKGSADALAGVRTSPQWVKRRSGHLRAMSCPTASWGFVDGIKMGNVRVRAFGLR